MSDKDIMPDLSKEYKPVWKWGRQYARGDEQGYEELAQTLQLAYFRACKFKGKTRHADGNPFIQQEICADLRTLKSVTPALFQARKKIKESIRLDRDESVAELLDAIVYLSAAVIVLTEDTPTEK